MRQPRQLAHLPACMQGKEDPEAALIVKEQVSCTFILQSQRQSEHAAHWQELASPLRAGCVSVCYDHLLRLAPWSQLTCHVYTERGLRAVQMEQDGVHFMLASTPQSFKREADGSIAATVKTADREVKPHSFDCCCVTCMLMPHFCTCILAPLPCRQAETARSSATIICTLHKLLASDTIRGCTGCGACRRCAGGAGPLTHSGRLGPAGCWRGVLLQHGHPGTPSAVALSLCVCVLLILKAQALVESESCHQHIAAAQLAEVTAGPLRTHHLAAAGGHLNMNAPHLLSFAICHSIPHK